MRRASPALFCLNLSDKYAVLNCRMYQESLKGVIMIHNYRIRYKVMAVSAFVILSLAAALNSRAQWPLLDGTMSPYDFSSVDPTLPWGGDMKPVYINYVARHGARFLSSEKKVADLKSALEAARKEGALSEKGEAFLSLLDTVVSATGDNWGALNSVGIMEEKRLGQEMAAVAPSLLKNGKVEAISSYVPRVVMTMYELCHELARCYSGIEVTTSEGKQFNPLMRYFTVDTAYVAYLKDGPWKPLYDSYAAKTLPAEPAKSMFKAGCAPDDSCLKKLSFDAYGVLQSLNAAGIRGDASEWFTEADYRRCWEVSNLRHYYQRSVSEVSSLPAKAAGPLLRDIISKTDSAVAGKTNLAASLRFGHAETVIPLFALMRLPGCYVPDASAGEVAARWCDRDVSPLGANLMMVVLKARSGEDYAALRLNGKWISIGNKKLMPWPELRSLWESYMRD